MVGPDGFTTLCEAEQVGAGWSGHRIRDAGFMLRRKQPNSSLPHGRGRAGLMAVGDITACKLKNVELILAGFSKQSRQSERADGTSARVADVK